MTENNNESLRGLAESVVKIIFAVFLLIFSFQPWLSVGSVQIAFTRLGAMNDVLLRYGMRVQDAEDPYIILFIVFWILPITAAAVALSEIKRISEKSQPTNDLVVLMGFFSLCVIIIGTICGWVFANDLNDYFWFGRGPRLGEGFWGCTITIILLMLGIPEKIAGFVLPWIPKTDIKLPSVADVQALGSSIKKTIDSGLNLDEWSGSSEEKVIYENLTMKDAPIALIKSSMVYKKRGDEIKEVYVKNLFKNISGGKTISALQISIVGFDPFDTSTDQVDNYAYMDLNVRSNELFGDRKTIPLPSGKARKAVVMINQVLFDDGTVWKRSDENLIPYVPTVIDEVKTDAEVQNSNETQEEEWTVICPECSAKISVMDVTCPNCGYPMDEVKK